jgi:CubicO group peptidase (beta-lactamase class C family)
MAMETLQVAAVLVLAAATSTAAEPGAERLETAFGDVRKAVTDGEVPGAAALIAQRGKVLRHEALGLCDVEQKRLFTTDTLCWIASITKPVTVATAMKLVEQGKLGLDDAIEDYLPEFKQQVDKSGEHHRVTIRQLMSHTSGILANPPSRPSFFFSQEWLGREIAEIPPLIAKTPLEFTPGSKVLYSNAAPYVLARIIELRSGMKFHAFVQQAILDPAGMKDTYFIIPRSEANRVAVVYRETPTERVTFFRFDPTWDVKMTLPDGGLFSHPSDIRKFVQLFLDDDGSVLSHETVKVMLTPQAAGWGLGWAIDDDGVFSHTGSSGTAAFADPKTGVIGILFCQIQNPKMVDPLQARFKQAVRAAFADTMAK